ncbi:3-isopropylmalate dehydratase small subunit [Buchnera aphidicola (Myzocallis carpini)]
MKKFISHTGIIAPLNFSNVDTDAIIPKQFLQKIERTGFANDLFYNWRFLEGNIECPNKNFVLNNPTYQKSSILLSRENFGCGSSREHAVWALLDYGFRAIIAASFSDIFYSNSFNNNLLLIILSIDNINNIFEIIKKKPGILATINLYYNYITIENHKYSFQIDDFYRSCLLNGVDNIDITLQYKKHITQYEKKIPNFLNK